MGKIEKVFKNGEVLFAEDLNPIVKQVNDNADDIAGNGRAIVALGQTQQTQGETIQTQGQALQAMGQAVSALAQQGYKFAGVAALAEDPGTPAMSVFKIASAIGSYTDYGLEVTQQDGVCAFLYDKSAAEPAWAKLPLGIPFPQAAGMITENVETGTIEAQSNHYYNVAEDVETLELTLPTPTEGKADVVKVHFFAGQGLSMSVDGGQHPVMYIGAALKPRWEYVLTFAFDGAKWNATSESLTPNNCLVFQSDSEFELNFGYQQYTRLIEYSTDGFNWNTEAGNSISAVNNGRKYMLLVRGRGNAQAPTISMSAQGLVDCLGDVRTILDFSSHGSIQLTEMCFMSMFNGCTSLRTAPDLPATTLADSCYSNMFRGCTSLVQAPALPATTLADSCYSTMFRDCTSLVQAPALPATTLASLCYSGMFNGCTSLTQAPALPATTLAERCYNIMFRNCNSLADITMTATDISATGCLSSWVAGVAATGTFHKAEAMETLPTGDSGIPTGWQVVNV